LAEWILSLVTSPERAVATVGDLCEEGARPLALWRSVAWMVLALIGRELLGAPLRMLGLAVYGFVIGIVLSACQGVAAAGLIVLVFPRALASVNTVVATSLLLGWAGSFISGILVARRATGREISACVAVVILDTLVTLATTGMSPAAPSEAWYAGVLGSTFILLISQLLLIAGATRVRRRRLHA
jgi:hypothetical protein